MIYRNGARVLDKFEWKIFNISWLNVHKIFSINSNCHCHYSLPIFHHSLTLLLRSNFLSGPKQYRNMGRDILCNWFFIHHWLWDFETATHLLMAIENEKCISRKLFQQGWIHCSINTSKYSQWIFSAPCLCCCLFNANYFVTFPFCFSFYFLFHIHFFPTILEFIIERIFLENFLNTFLPFTATLFFCVRTCILIHFVAKLHFVPGTRSYSVINIFCCLV